MSPDETSRREFVALTCACCAAALGADALADEAPQPTTIDLGPLSDFKTEGPYDKFARSKKLLVLSTGKRIAVATARCTHKTCVLKVNEGQLNCPCHKSKFDNDGIPLNGPAKVSLNRYG
ncbi:MAG TPA: Rieske (2Fe-2S) protein, partial [Tepidisphaeraceae bacterium]|nr:Rieske (2Fe-2S) protein [Tepidisphaeraceae bacterium]